MRTSADVADEMLFDNWFDPIEMELRAKVRGFIETMIEKELEMALARPRYGRQSGLLVEDGFAAPIAGHRHGRRIRSLTGTFGPTEIIVPRWRLPSEIAGGGPKPNGAPSRPPLVKPMLIGSVRLVRRSAVRAVEAAYGAEALHRSRVRFEVAEHRGAFWKE